MSEQDQNIENFFRKRLGSPSDSPVGSSSGQKKYAYSEADWSLLEAKLDAMPVPLPSSGITAAKMIVISGVLVVMSFLAGWFLKEALDSDKAVLTLPIESPPPSTVAVRPIPPLNEIAQQVAPNKAALHMAPDGGLATSEGTQDETTDNTIRSGTPPIVAIPAVSIPPRAPGINVPVGIAEANGVSTMENVISVTRLSSKQAESLRPAARDAEQLLFPSYAPDKPEEKVKRSFGKLAVGAGFSPDFSTVGPAPDFRQAGMAFGALIDYRLGPRWRLSTGVYKSNKQYEAKKGDYTPPLYGGWPGGVEPSSTDATCAVLDVPIIVSFMALGGPKTAFWINGGLSSYWMLSEAYYYHYDVEGGGRPRGWWGENENKHLLSVASFSVSVEKFVSKRLSVQLEPFFKIPLAGVGYGKVRLYTAGSFVSLKYHFQQKNI